MSAKCGRCATDCQLYAATGAPEDIPCHRSELLLRVYRRYFTPSGVLKARMFGGFELTDAYLDEMAEAFYRCTACRRCKASCPMGIDHGLVTHLARWVLAEVGVIPRALLVSVREQLDGKSGNTSAIPLPALKDTCEFLTEELHDIYDVDIEYPFDVEGAEYVFFPAVSDYIMEADTLMGNAAVMHVTGGSWTIGTGNYDGINYGLFYRDRMMERIVRRVVAEVRRLHGRKILIGECGHATRSAWYVPTFAGPDAPPVVNCLEYAWDMLEAGRIPLKAERIPERVTYHDPCNIARVGRITEQPREILKAICADYVEMTPNRTRQLLLRRRRRHGVDRRDPGVPHGPDGPAEGRADPRHRGADRGLPLRQLQEAAPGAVPGQRPGRRGGGRGARPPAARHRLPGRRERGGRLTMDGWLHVARGPLFQAALAFMLLGLARQLALTLWEAGRAYRRAGDRTIPAGQVAQGHRAVARAPRPPARPLALQPDDARLPRRRDPGAAASWRATSPCGSVGSASPGPRFRTSWPRPSRWP